jgi:metal-sulfur cluster biosynthetic enzyme
MEALRDVSDPELPLSVVDMGLVYGVWLEGDAAHVKLTYTSMGCPCADFIVEDVRERLLREDGVARVEVEIVWDPPWSKRMLSQEARDTLAEFGVAV